MPRCPKCGCHKQASEFVRNRANASGLHSYCKPCHNTYVKENRIKHHGDARNYFLKLRYGVDAETVRTVLWKQGAMCAICWVEPAIHVDHDHPTGEVRGILCFNCNKALGYFEEDVAVMQAAIDYLEGPQA